MMKNRIFLAALCGSVLLTLAGCGGHTEKEMSESSLPETVSETITAESKPETRIPESTESPAETQAPEQITAEKEDTAPPVQTAKMQTPAQTQKADTKQTAKQTETPAPPQTQATTAKSEKPAVTTAKPAETTAAPEFNINYWISYAQSYAQSIGLRLESSAVDCWDNPMVAGSHSIYLERDIKGILNKYNRDEDITDVWIWAEKRSDGSYDLYIGYA